MAKNNILLAVLVASFTAPIFSMFPTKCPLNQNGKLVATTLVVDATSSRFLGLKPAFELRSNVAAQPVVVAQKKDAQANNEEAPVAVAPVKSLKNTVLNTNVTVGLNTVGVDRTLQINLLPLAFKVVAAAGLLKATDLVVEKLTSEKK